MSVSVAKQVAPRQIPSQKSGTRFKSIQGRNGRVDEREEKVYKRIYLLGNYGADCVSLPDLMDVQHVRMILIHSNRKEKELSKKSLTIGQKSKKSPPNLIYNAKLTKNGIPFHSPSVVRPDIDVK